MPPPASDVPDATPAPLDYTPSRLRVRRDFAAPAALAIGLLALAFLLIWSSIPTGLRLRWAWQHSPLTDADVWPITLALSATAALLALYSVVRSRRRRLRPRPAALTALLLALVTPAVASARGFPPHMHDHYNFSKCGANVSSVYKLAYLAAINRGGRFPDQLEDALADDGYKGVETLDCPVCSRRGQPRPRGVRPPPTDPPDYHYFGKGLTLTTLTPAHVIACDKLENHDAKGYDLWVVYGDGAIRPVPRDRLKSMISDLQSGQNPPRP